MTVYRVTGQRAYRGHRPGSTFEAHLDPHAERRALQREDIQVIHRTNPTLQPGSYTLPTGWLNTEEV